MFVILSKDAAQSSNTTGVVNLEEETGQISKVGFLLQLAILEMMEHLK
jgi:hypothetical protein